MSKTNDTKVETIGELEQAIETHLEMLMPVELQQDIGCDESPCEGGHKRDMSQRIGRIIGRCTEQAAKIQQLEKVLQEMQDYGCHIRDESGYVCSVVKDKERLETELAEARQMIEQLRPFKGYNK